MSDPKRLAHLLLNKVHDVFEVQIVIVVLDSSSNVVIQKVDGLFRQRNYKGRRAHIPRVPPEISQKSGLNQSAHMPRGPLSLPAQSTPSTPPVPIGCRNGAPHSFTDQTTHPGQGWDSAAQVPGLALLLLPKTGLCWNLPFALQAFSPLFSPIQALVLQIRRPREGA